MMPEVKAKTLILFGSDDLICSPEGAEQTRRAVPDAQLILYGESGHFPWIEQEKVLLDIVAFLTE
jgi:pimeloyl-ACP methyl ester carboxylesterase